MTPFVCRTLEEHQTRTAEVQRDRKIARDAWVARMPGCIFLATDLNSYLDQHYPLPVLAPQGVRGRSGARFEFTDGLLTKRTDGGLHRFSVVSGDRQAAALALLGAEGHATMVSNALAAVGLGTLPASTMADLIDRYSALCAKAGQ